MNSLAVTTLLAYLLLGGMAFAYGSLRSQEPPAEQAKQEAQARQEAFNKEARATWVPLTEPIHVDLVYTGADKTGGSAHFKFNTRWGQIHSQWKTGEQELTAGPKAGATAKVDLDWCTVEIKPVFGPGRKGQYSLKLRDKAGALLGAFDIIETGKQVKPQNSATPGYVQRLVFFEPEKRVTTYRILKSGSKKEDACALVFLGKGFSTAEVSKGIDREAIYLFPEVKFIVLHPEWLERNDLNTVMNLVKRGM
jgi:hypothetical protein